MQYSQFIQELLENTSKIANLNFGKPTETSIKTNDNNQVLTKTDLEIGEFIINRIKEKFPKHNIIDEEAGVIDNKSEYTWVIDPIDGTSNFAQGVPTYGTIIGLLNKDRPIAGGCSLPFFNEIVVAESGEGTYCNGKRLKVTEEINLSSSLIAYAIDSHRENPETTRGECSLLAVIILGIRNLRVSGSVFDSIMVAKGKYGAYLNRTSKIWDNVGQQVIIEEAGGIYTDFLGNKINYSNPLTKATQNFTFCAGSPDIHRQLMNIVNKKS
ncbi:inositol monophosphatase [Candidatus Microgenomates bacterium]|nr:MAG: inositol monophosphatase [Candidatus Microgenomates bacterium]